MRGGSARSIQSPYRTKSQSSARLGRRDERAPMLRSRSPCAERIKAGLYDRDVRRLREPSVAVSLPDSDYFLTVPVQSVHWSAPGTAHAEVVKDGGDDPDNT